MGRKSLQMRIVFWAGVCLLITGGAILGFSIYITGSVTEQGISESRKLVGQMAQESRERAIAAAEDGSEHAQSRICRLPAIPWRTGKRLQDHRNYRRLLPGGGQGGGGLGYGRTPGGREFPCRNLLNNNPEYIAGTFSCWEKDGYDADRSRSWPVPQGLRRKRPSHPLLLLG